MKRGQEKLEKRSKVLQERRGCSKIEAKLLSRRRSKLENEEKKNSSRLKEASQNSSSDSDSSPRLFTSKQHVELVNFEPQKLFPLFRKSSKIISEKSSKIRKVPNDVKNKWSSQSEIFENRSNAEDENCDGKKKKITNILENDAKKVSSINFQEMENRERTKLQRNLKKESNEVSNAEKCKFDKKRSRSAPCTPLFKIKCCKDKFPRDLFLDGNLLADNEICEKIRKYKKTLPLGLRISRSGDVAISSREKLSSEKIIERTSDEKFDDNEKILNNFLLSMKISAKFQPEDEKISLQNSPTTKTMEQQQQQQQKKQEELINSEKETNNSEMKSESQKSSEMSLKNCEIICKEAVGQLENGENSKDEETLTTIEKKNNSDEKECENSEDKLSELKKMPKKRDFKWETILEKQHRKFKSSSPDKCKNSSETTEEASDDKFQFWRAKTANVERKISRPKARNSFEGKKLEAYAVIKEELPKLFMKRQILNSMNNKKSKMTDKKISNIQNVEKLNSPSTKNAIINCEHWKNSNDNDERSSKEIVRFDRKKMNENSPENLNKEKNSWKKIIEPDRNIRASILKRRKTPSPRRVTFRLPGLIIDEEISREKFNCGKRIVDKEFKKNDNETHKSIVEYNRREKDDCKRQDNFYSRVQKEDRIGWRNAENAQYFSTIESEDNFRELEDSEQDWETPTSEDIYRSSKDITFPKETREAMKILERAKEDNRRYRIDYPKRSIDRRGTYWQREENLKMKSVPIASTHAKAVARYQESCGYEGDENFAVTTRQNRGTRNVNIAVGK